jgi:hypothetical protein
MPKTQDMIAKTTLRPGQKGTKHLMEKYGERLICVRYRYDETTHKRYTTVELIEAEATWTDTEAQPPEQQHLHRVRVGVRIEYGETELRDKAKQLGAIWRPRHKLWEMSYDDAIALGLEACVAVQGDFEGILYVAVHTPG